MGDYKFSTDLSLGQYGEKIVTEDLISMGGELVEVCDNKYYDLIISKKGKETKYEVKTDDLCQPHRDTANLFIEFESRGKLSGISVSESDYFVYYYLHLGEIWYFSTKELKLLIKGNDFPIIENGGDIGSNTKGYLINRYLPFVNKLAYIRKVPKPSWDIYLKLK